MTGISVVVWDWNGTLLDDVDVCFATINTVLTTNGCAALPDLAAYRRSFCFPVSRYYENVGFDFARTPFAVLADQFMSLYHPAAAHCALQPGAVETLAALQARGLRQVLLSASLQEHLELQAARYPIAGYFDRLLGIGDIYAKSKQQLACDFVRGCGAAPRQVLFIGDSVHDFEVAQACGCPCVLYAGGHQARAALAATGSPVIEALAQLPGLLGAEAPARKEANGTKRI